MILNRIDNAVNREGRNKLNENWETLERTYKKVVDDSNEAKTTAVEAKGIAQGIDGKATEALSTANQANTKSDNAVNIATQKGDEAISIVTAKGNEAVSIAKQKGDESISIAKQKGDESISIATQKGNEAIDIANQANNTSNYVQQQLDTVILENGDANPEVAQARAEFVNLRERLDTEFNEVKTELEQTAPKDRNAFAARTWGRFETGAVLASIANEENPRPQVVGINTPKELSKIISRDSVSHYVSNKGVNPTLDITGGTSYTINSVTLPSSADLSKLEIGMIIDTKHTPNSFVGVIESIEGNVVYIEDGWYETKEGIGSETPTIPSDGIGLLINNVRKIWGVNNNVLLPEDKATNRAVGEEMGLFNGKPFESSDVGGFDLVNFNGKVHYGFKVRRSPNSTGGFLQAFRVESSDQAFVNIGVNPTDILLSGFLNGENTNAGFYIRNDGLQSKIKLRPTIYANGINNPQGNDSKILIVNKTQRETLTIIDPTNRGGELLFVINNGSAVVDLVCQGSGRFNQNGLQYSTIPVLPRSSLILVSDNSSYFILFGSLENDTQIKAVIGSNNPTGNLTPLFVGQEYIDTANKVAYKACGLTSSDWKQISN